MIKGISVATTMVVAICLIGVAASLEWSEFTALHGRSYGNRVEESMRHQIFIKNKQKVEKFNAEQSKEAGYEMALNHLSDMTEAELKGMLGAKPPNDWSSKINTPEGEEYLAELLAGDSDPLPGSMDWRNVSGVVGSVRNQGMCGSCWAFSTVGLLEGQQLKVTKGKRLIELSEQNLVDCVTRYGCSGSWPMLALVQIFEEGGIQGEATYPYTGRDGTCSFGLSKSIMTTRGPVVLPKSEEVLKAVVAKYGPVSIVFSVPDEFFTYKSGVLKVAECPSDFQGAAALHAVLVVGYGTDLNGGDYWLVKNSWGPAWGESGYFRMARNNNNMCGVVTMAVIAAL